MFVIKKIDITFFVKNKNLHHLLIEFLRLEFGARIRALKPPHQLAALLAPPSASRQPPAALG
jgi:hypothetical protein